MNASGGISPQDSGKHRASVAETRASLDDLIVVSNREPYSHGYGEDGSVEVSRPAGGLTAGLDEAMQTTSGTWIAWGDGSADFDVVDEDGEIDVPPDAESTYTLRRLPLSDEQIEGYYYGFSNRVLWPLCHGSLNYIHEDVGYWETYREVNGIFADAVVEAAADGATVWFQDYHLALAPAMVAERVPAETILAQFWHIPWPGVDIFRACPHKEELLEGLLGNDLFGVHLPRYRDNFLRCVEATLPGATVDHDAAVVTYNGSTTSVRAFPMGVSADKIRAAAESDEARAASDAFLADHGVDEETRIAIGVDRLDYTKGIPQRLAALERFWERYPEWRGKLTFVQLGTESRSRIPAYEELQETVAEGVERINERFGTDDWQPVVYSTAWIENETLYGLYHRADLGIVSPIRDGMNLVAQEFIAAQPADPGVLVLSDQAGAYDWLGDSLLSVTPQDIERFAETIHEAVTLSPEERAERLLVPRARVETHDIETWLSNVFRAANGLDEES